MGWLANPMWENQKDVEAEILKRDDSDISIIDKSSRSGKLWVLFEHRITGDRFIALYLIQSCGSRFERGEWGYKDMDESMGPCYYDCPQRLLKGSNVPDTSGWREKCLNMAKRKRELKRTYASLRNGDRLILSRNDSPEKRVLTFNYRHSDTQIVATNVERRMFRYPMDHILRWDNVEVIKA